MCGIVGYFSKNEVDKSYIYNMTKIIEHRGPDDSGIEFLSMFGKQYDNIAVGFDRLSIRDLSMNGHQPMFNEDKSIMIIFNGEIYNADELREPLLDMGRVFKSGSDTEVILQMYEEYGVEKTVSLLNGMYAIGMFDMKKDAVYLIRDRVGEKPLYYYKSDNSFMFASEYKAFYAHAEFRPELNIEELDEYFMYRYISDNTTLLKGVYNIRPGHYLKITEDGINEVEYYKIPAEGQNKIVNQSEFDNAVKKSVESRMVSDVEVGVQLSGGIDSSVVTLFANEKSENIKAFSMVFDDPRYSEEKYVDDALSITGGKPYKYKIDSSQFYEDFINCTWNFEAPINHHGSVQLYHLCKQAKKDVSVILTGEGADELMGGYTWYPVSMFYNHNKFAWKFRTLLHRIKGTNERYWEDIKGYTDEEKFLLADTQIAPNLLMKAFPQIDYKKILEKRKEMYHKTTGDNLIKKLNYEMRTFMVDLLMRQDKISMSSSIECRVPFVDQDLIEYVRKNVSEKDLVRRQSFGTKKQNTKLVLKDLSRKHFGNEFTDRTKMGLPSPLHEYFYTQEFKTFFNDVVMPNAQKRGFINCEYVKKCYDEKKNLQSVVWRVVAFEAWAHMYLDNNGQEVCKYAGIQ